MSLNELKDLFHSRWYDTQKRNLNLSVWGRLIIIGIILLYHYYFLSTILQVAIQIAKTNNYSFILLVLGSIVTYIMVLAVIAFFIWLSWLIFLLFYWTITGNYISLWDYSFLIVSVYLMIFGKEKRR